MNQPRLIFSGIIGLGVLAHCAKKSEPPPAPASASAAPAATDAPRATATVATAAPAAATPAPAGYPMCAGEHVTQTLPASHSGAVSVQLAPAFLDEMASCKGEDSMAKDLPSRAGEGSIDQKGDCVFASVGVSCHYHSASEFITSSTKSEPVGQGELHCIVPSDDPKSPRVFGAHVRCSDPKRSKPPSEHAAHEAKTGAACNAGLLSALASCQSAKCCDDGTLTNAIGDLVHDGRNDVRPDFRICEQTLTIDCSLLENLTAHTANAPALGGLCKPVFGVESEKGKAGAHDKHAHAAKP